jgi:hypothetical protein
MKGIIFFLEKDICMKDNKVNQLYSNELIKPIFDQIEEYLKVIKKFIFTKRSPLNQELQQ